MASPDKPTSFDIAALAGVSQPTVSRALRGDPTVNEGTRKRIEAIAAQLGYKVDKNASALRRGQSSTLALLFFEDPLPDGTAINPFFLAMLGSILRTCAKRGYDLLTSFQQLSSNWHKDYEDARKADGLILLGYGDYELYRARLQDLVRQGTHFVRWGSVELDGLGTTIGCDNMLGGRLAAAHLLAQGRRRLAFIGEATSHYPEFRDRYHGFCDIQLEAGIEPDPRLQTGALSIEESGFEAARRLLAGRVPFDAIFAASDLIAMGALRALQEAGKSVPGDISVVGFDDIPAASLTNPPLTTVAQDYNAAGEMLVDTLIGEIGNHSSEMRLLPPRLIVRRTS